MTYIRIFLLIISVRGSLWQECVSIEKDPASKKTNKIRKSDLLLIDLAPGGPGKCSALKRGSCQGRSPVFMNFFLLKALKGDSLVTITTILFFFSSQVIHQIPVNWTFNVIDCQYDYRAFPADATCWLWIPTKN